jgi:hydrogenase maturation protease
MDRALVIGYGNPLRGDDGVGWQAAERLRSAPDRPGLAVVACHQLTPELAEPLSRADRVVFIDAVPGSAAGRVTARRLTAAAAGSPSFTHNLDPAALLGLAAILYGTAPRDAFIVTIDAESFGYTEQLSATIEAAMPDLLRLVVDLADGRTDTSIRG